MKNVLVFTILLTSISSAAAPDTAELQAALMAAERAWKIRISEPIEFRTEPLNSCELRRDIPTIFARADVTDVSSKIVYDESGQEYSSSRRMTIIIRINSNCDWTKLPLRKTIIHMYGSMLIGAEYQTDDKRSIMYSAVNLRRQRITRADRLALAEALAERSQASL